MTDVEFARGLVEQVVDENTAIYADLFGSTTADSVRDPYWRAAARLYAALPVDQRTTFVSILRQVTIDAVASVLGVIDGVTSLPVQSEALELREGRVLLSGALQDHFLAATEA